MTQPPPPRRPMAEAQTYQEWWEASILPTASPATIDLLKLWTSVAWDAASRAGQQSGREQAAQVAEGFHSDRELHGHLDCYALRHDIAAASAQREREAIVAFLKDWEYYGDGEDGKRLAEWIGTGQHLRRPPPPPEDAMSDLQVLWLLLGMCVIFFAIGFWMILR